MRGKPLATLGRLAVWDLGTGLLLLFWPLLLLLAERPMLLGQETDADALIRAAPRAIFAPVRVGGGSGLSGRFLSGGAWPSSNLFSSLERGGWHPAEQFGAMHTFRRGDANVSLNCRMFSVLFTVCDVEETVKRRPGKAGGGH